MAEDWAKVAREVDAAMKSVADISQAGGYPATLHIPGSSQVNSWDPPTVAASWDTVYVVEGVREIRSADNTLILETRRTLLISAAGTVPVKGMQVAVGVTADDAEGDSGTVYSEIIEVRPTSPAGTSVLYECDLGN